MAGSEHEPGEATRDAFAPVLAAARAGASWAWRDLHSELAPAIRAYVRLRGSSEPDDLVSETFVHVARRIDAFEGTAANFRSWVFTIAHHRLVDERRRRGRRPLEAADAAEVIELRADAAVPAPDARLLDGVGASRVERLLGGLTGDQRSVILLRVLGEQTLEETSRALGKPVTSVKALQRRALRALRRAVLAEDGGDG